MSEQKRAFVIGAGLAGSEAAYQLARRGIAVTLIESRPHSRPPAHVTDDFAELVCSNSLGADKATSPAGILKEELRSLGSLIIRCAEATRVPAGGALAVDRVGFAAMVTREIESMPLITVERREATEFPQGAPVILATGPLMHGEIAERLREVIGQGYLSFFDAAAPIISLDSLDMTRAYRAGRYGQSDDYINCPMNKEEYEAFHAALVSADRVPLHEVDFRGETPAEDGAPKKKDKRFFEGCLPAEVMADRGLDTLRFGPMKPVGLPDPSTGREPYAVIQLRRDNAEGTLYNMVGFQTNLKWGEQERVFRMVPALRDAEFVRKGVMHRNTFVCAPVSLDNRLRPSRDGVPAREDLFLAGQITGVEGYTESTSMGLVAALNVCAMLNGQAMPEWPDETAIGSLLRYLRTATPESFQPMNVNLGIFPPLTPAPGAKKKKINKQDRSLAYAERSAAAMKGFFDRYDFARL